MKQKTLKQDITISGALGAGASATETIQIPSDVRVIAVRFTEVANSTGCNYDLQIQDKTGIVIDDTHRLDAVGVVNGSTFRNVPFCDNMHPAPMDGNQNVSLRYRLIDALAGGQSIRLRVTYICQYN